MAILLVGALALFFQKTATGRALRAVADDHQAAQSVGIPLNRIWVIVWAVAGVVAIVAGVIWGGKLGVQFSISLVALKALPVVILGGFTSVPGAIIGGLIIGVGEKMAEVFLGLPLVKMFDLAGVGSRIGSLTCSRCSFYSCGPRACSASATSIGSRVIYRENGQFKSTYRGDLQMLPILQDRIVLAGVVAFAFLVVPFVTSDYLFLSLVIPFLILALAAIGLNLLVGYCGQISIGHAAFMAVGAYAAYNLVLRVPWLNFLVVLVLAGIIAAAAGMLFGIPSLRIKGLYLAVATLAAQFFSDCFRPGEVVHQLCAFRFGVHRARGTFRLACRHAGRKVSVPPRRADRVHHHREESHARTSRPRLDGDARYGRGRRSDRHSARVCQAHRVRGQRVLLRHSGRPVGIHPSRLLGAARVQPHALAEPALHDHHRGYGVDSRGVLRGGHRRAPILLNQVPQWLGVPISTATASHLEFMIFGALIVLFLILSPTGSRMWSIGKEKLRLWPFPH